MIQRASLTGLLLTAALLTAQPAGPQELPRTPADDAVLAGPLQVAGETVAGLFVHLARQDTTAQTVPVIWSGGSPPVGFAPGFVARFTREPRGVFGGLATRYRLDFGADPALGPIRAPNGLPSGGPSSLATCFLVPQPRR